LAKRPDISVIGDDLANVNVAAGGSHPYRLGRHGKADSDFKTEAIMTRSDRPTALAAAAIVVGSLFLPVLASAASGAAPFCIARGGGGGEGGGGGSQDCRYYDWQTCLQAAAARGNCVQNIDYHGEVSTAPAAAPVRHRH
jgi:hypothetical protein